MNVPKLRFKNAEGADFPLWTMSKLGNEVQFSKGGKLGKSDLQKEGSHQCLLYGELYTSYGSIASKIFSRTDTDSDTTSQKYDVVMPTSGETAEDIATATCIPFDGILYGGDLIILRSQTLYGPFLSYQINSSLKRKISRVAQGKSVVHIGAEKIKPISFSFPCLEEQQKIASFFSTLDQKIELNERKLEVLEKLKKGMMQKIFNRKIILRDEKGDYYPEWTYRRIEDFSDVKTGPFGSALHSSDYVENGTPIITTEHFKNGSIPKSKANLPQVSKENYRRLSAYVLREGDIVFSRVGSVDRCAYVTDAQEGWLFSGRVLRVRPDRSVDTAYLHHILWTDSVRRDIQARAVGLTMPSINTQILKKTQLLMSASIEEQVKIGAFFNLIDERISLQREEINALYNLKTGFMQKMFA